jgi:hypothetical protein
LKGLLAATPAGDRAIAFSDANSSKWTVIDPERRRPAMTGEAKVSSRL